MLFVEDAYDAVVAFVANDAVPNNDPVNEVAVTLVVTDNEFRAASEPLTTTLRQFGILNLL
jgi:hypothetical protein